MPALPRPCLMILSDRTRLTPNWTLAQAIAPAVTGGANIVVFRDGDLPPVPRSAVFRFVRDGVEGRVPLIAQGDPEWALKVGADGAHLEGTASAQEARAALGPERWVGMTVTTLEQARDAGAFADYLLINVDWSDPKAALGIIERYAHESAAPVVVGRDVPVDQVVPCLSAGAAGVAIIEPAMAAYDRTGSVRHYADAMAIHPPS